MSSSGSNGRIGVQGLAEGSNGRIRVQGLAEGLCFISQIQTHTDIDTHRHELICRRNGISRRYEGFRIRFVNALCNIFGTLEEAAGSITRPLMISATIYC
ncbi:hypothetical protein L2E82_10264 [Cichorium intybus]|uniref:Uncharacterized protein n=1 Tax=Cichorium intybus TaxID=13427 RepID=A0ACB9GB42_CICIN|nr:hypothetical protein L2E82_10264 [Cichorium intybus]